MATAEQLTQAIGLIQGNQHADAEALLTPLLNQSATDAEALQSDVERMTVGFDVLPAPA